MDDCESWDGMFAHREWVRALAVRLCADSGASDDLVQDTWVEVLRGGGTRGVARPWLGGIVRHLWRRRVRRDEARRERELAHSRGEAVPSPDELFAQAELQNRVLAAVASLDESYRAVVLLKHYEGLGAEQIAARLRCPSSTVRNRLARAHELLRAKLDRDYGTRGAWSVLFVPVLELAPSIEVAVGVGVAMKIGIAIGAAALALVVLLFWSRGPTSTTASGGLAATGEPAIESPQDALSAREPEQAERTRVEAAPSASRSTHRFDRVLVWGEVEGKPADSEAGAQISFFDERGGEHQATLGGKGGYSLFGLAPGRYRIVGWNDGCWPIDGELELDGSVERVRHDVTFTAAITLPVRIVERGSGALYEPAFLDPIGVGLCVVATREKPQRIEGVDGRSAWNVGDGLYRSRAEFARSKLLPAGASGVLELHAEPPLFASLVMRSVVLESRLVAGTESELVFEVDPAELEKQLGALTVRCVDAATGEALAGAQVNLGFTDGGVTSGTSDADGLVHLERLTPGLRTLGVVASGFADVGGFVSIEPGQVVELGTLELTRPALISGLVFTKDGTPVTAQLRWLALDRLHSPRDADIRADIETRADGSFEFDWLGAERLRLVAIADGWAITALDVDARSGAAAGLEIELERGTRVVVRTRPGVYRGSDVLLCDAQGLPLLFDMVHASHPGGWSLRPGRYELRRIADERVLGTQWFDVGTEALTVELETP